MPQTLPKVSRGASEVGGRESANGYLPGVKKRAELCHEGTGTTPEVTLNN